VIDEAGREGERESERDGFFFNKKKLLGSYSATQPKHVNMMCLLWSNFCEF